MSLIHCPSCNKKISDKVQECPNCQFSLNQNNDDIERLKVLKYRKYRDTMFRYKMLTFVAMGLVIAGLIPMMYSYAKAIDYGFNVKFTSHWGIYLVMAGFALYVLVRLLMFTTKRNYKQTK